MLTTSFEDPKLQALLDKIARDGGFKQPTFTISLGSKPGDNFIGRIYRAIISEKDNPKDRLSLIFKASPLSTLRQEMLSSDVVFATESKVYQQVLPTLNDYMNKHGVTKSSTFPGTARCFAVDLADQSKPNDIHVLVLEDKSTGGFQMADRRKGLDAGHVRLAYEKLAYIHGTSLALYHKEPETAKRLWDVVRAPENWFNNANHPLLNDLKDGQRMSLKALKEPYKKGNPVYDRLEKSVENFNAEHVRLNAIPKDVPCIIHGDCWTNNLLFKYNKEGNVEDICMIDLQLTRVCSPAIELLYLMYLCTTKETRDAHYSDLIRSYYDKLSSVLRAFDCDPEEVMSWELLQEHLRHYGLFAVLITLTAIPVFLADSADINIDTGSSKDEGSVFSGCAKVTDPIKLEEISNRVTDVVHDADLLGFI